MLTGAVAGVLGGLGGEVGVAAARRHARPAALRPRVPCAQHQREEPKPEQEPKTEPLKAVLFRPGYYIAIPMLPMVGHQLWLAYQVLSAAMLVAGIVRFTLGDVASSPAFAPIGVILIAGALCGDARRGAGSGPAGSS